MKKVVTLGLEMLHHINLKLRNTEQYKLPIIKQFMALMIPADQYNF
jgi:hypothetical protein